MPTLTAEDRKIEHARSIEKNRAMGVIEYESREPVSDQVWEIVDGKHHLPGLGKKPGRSGAIGIGHRFRPTARQVEQTLAGRGGLLNKARPLTASEMDGLGRRAFAPGGDIGLRQFRMAEGTLKYAIEVGLTEDDFRGVEPEGSAGYFTRTQVEAIAESRTSPAA
jgi:hypothetical protein